MSIARTRTRILRGLQRSQPGSAPSRRARSSRSSWASRARLSTAASEAWSDASFELAGGRAPPAEDLARARLLGDLRAQLGRALLERTQPLAQARRFGAPVLLAFPLRPAGPVAPDSLRPPRRPGTSSRRSRRRRDGRDRGLRWCRRATGGRGGLGLLSSRHGRAHHEEERQAEGLRPERLRDRHGNGAFPGEEKGKAAREAERNAISRGRPASRVARRVLLSCEALDSGAEAHVETVRAAWATASATAAASARLRRGHRRERERRGSRRRPAPRSGPSRRSCSRRSSIAWGAEAAQFFMSQGLALAILAWLQTLPEFAVEADIAWRQDVPNMTANFTGSLRLLVGLGWPMIFGVGARRAPAQDREVARARSCSTTSTPSRSWACSSRSSTSSSSGGRRSLTVWDGLVLRVHLRRVPLRPEPDARRGDEEASTSSTTCRAR